MAERLTKEIQNIMDLNIKFNIISGTDDQLLTWKGGVKSSND